MAATPRSPYDVGPPVRAFFFRNEKVHLQKTQNQAEHTQSNTRKTDILLLNWLTAMALENTPRVSDSFWQNPLPVPLRPANLPVRCWRYSTNQPKRARSRESGRDEKAFCQETDVRPEALSPVQGRHITHIPAKSLSKVWYFSVANPPKLLGFTIAKGKKPLFTRNKFNGGVGSICI
jgi:hypothetical protein